MAQYLKHVCISIEHWYTCLADTILHQNYEANWLLQTVMTRSGLFELPCASSYPKHGNNLSPLCDPVII